MKIHLSDVEFADLLLEEAARSREHLGACVTCRGEHERVTSELTALRSWIVAATDLPEFFWRQQRQAIRERMQSRAGLESLRWALAVGLALFAIAATLLLASPSRPLQQAHADPDHLLLLEVEQSLRQPVARALAPADLLAQEISRTSNQNSNP